VRPPQGGETIVRRPKLSVCMPTYNYARYLPEAIQSVLMQTFTDLELIIIDDCSRDNSAAIIADYARQDRRIVALINDRNIGMVANWNRALATARGEYIKFLFGDDALADRTALEKMVAVLVSDDGLSLVAAARRVVDERSRIVKVLSTYPGGASRRGADIIGDCIVEQQNRIGEPSAVLFRKKHAERGFDPRYRQIVDLEMWFHILEQGNFAYISEPLVSFRTHAEQQTRRNTLNPALLDEPFLLLEEYASKPYLKLEWIAKEYMRYLPVYSAWKLYRKHKRISRQAALDVIKKRYRMARFIVLYPFFKIYKLYLRGVRR
jgi:glycosyltransferase involved in cell wall biosynthesis